ncbi:MAG: hypothetical protein U1E36_05490 [Rickettsiales bacterium]
MSDINNDQMKKALAAVKAAEVAEVPLAANESKRGDGDVHKMSVIVQVPAGMDQEVVEAAFVIAANGAGGTDYKAGNPIDGALQFFVATPNSPAAFENGLDVAAQGNGLTPEMFNSVVNNIKARHTQASR